MSLFPLLLRLLQIDSRHQYDTDLNIMTRWGYDEELKCGFRDWTKNYEARKRTKAVQTVYPAQANSSLQNNQDISLDSKSQKIVMLNQSIKQLHKKKKVLL